MMNNNKHSIMGLTLCEVENANLNMSCKDVEKQKIGDGNDTYTKKINGKGYCSAYAVKYAMKQFFEEQGGYEIDKVGDSGDPAKYINLDLFGHMRAKKGSNKKMNGKFYTGGLIGLGLNKVNKEFICKTNYKDKEGTRTNLLTKESYEDIMKGIFKLDIDRVGTFVVGDDKVEKKDYLESELDEANIDLSNEERFNRIKMCLESIEFLNIQSNQNNNLECVMPKFVILYDGSFGSNAFAGVIDRNGFNFEDFKNTYKKLKKLNFINSKIWIGIDRDFNSSYTFSLTKEELKQQFKDFKDIEITDVSDAFDNCLDYIKTVM